MSSRAGTALSGADASIKRSSPHSSFAAFMASLTPSV